MREDVNKSPKVLFEILKSLVMYNKLRQCDVHERTLGRKYHFQLKEINFSLRLSKTYFSFSRNNSFCVNYVNNSVLNTFLLWCIIISSENVVNKGLNEKKGSDIMQN